MRGLVARWRLSSPSSRGLHFCEGLEFNEGCTFAKVAGYVNPVQFVELLNSVLPVAPVNFAEFVGLVNAVRFMEYVNFAELVEGRQG